MEELKLYKVEKYKYMSKTNKDFIQNEIYYLRRTKRGTEQRLTSENEELQISDGKMSLISNFNSHFLKENFIYDGYELYSNHKDYVMNTITSKNEARPHNKEN